ncbi:hypothetical protein, partial [Enterocloster citroniae]
ESRKKSREKGRKTKLKGKNDNKSEKSRKEKGLFWVGQEGEFRLHLDIQAFAGPELEVSVWLRAFLIYGFKYKRTNVCIRG